MKSWYYLFITSLIASIASVIACLLLGYFGEIGEAAKLDVSAVSLVSGISLATGIVGGFVLDKLEGSGRRRLKWFINQPLMWQLVVYMIPAIIIVTSLSLIDSGVKNDYLKIVISIFNVTYSGFGILIVFLFFRMLFKK